MNTRENMFKDFPGTGNGHAEFIIRGVEFEDFLKFGENQKETIIGAKEEGIGENKAILFETFTGASGFGQHVSKAFPDAVVFAAEQWNDPYFGVFINGKEQDVKEFCDVKVDEEDTFLDIDGSMRLEISFFDKKSKASLGIVDFFGLPDYIDIDNVSYPSSPLEEYCPQITDKIQEFVDEFVDGAREEQR